MDLNSISTDVAVGAKATGGAPDEEAFDEAARDDATRRDVSIPERRHARERQAHWNRVARDSRARAGWGGAYHRRLAQVYRSVVMPGQRVLEIGCGRGDLLASLRPSFGVGVDFSPDMLKSASRRHPHLRFVRADAHALPLRQVISDLKSDGTPFDAIILSDLVNDLWDVQAVLQMIRPLCAPHTRLACNFFSRLWEAPLFAARRLGVAAPNMEQNWLAPDDVANLLYLAGFETVRRWEEVLWPLHTPGIDTIFNRFLVRLWPLKHGALANFCVARPTPLALALPLALPAAMPPQAARRGLKADMSTHAGEPLVSVIVPARNEAGNIEQIFQRVPEMGGGTELVFVEGHSRDNTYAAIERAIARHPERRCQLMRQSGEGKGDAVRLGFARAGGEILMILDADLTVAPEDLPRFYDVLRNGRGEFANGVRLVYPMEEQAMRFLNLVGNKAFSMAFSWLLGQPVKDTLCGTKVLRKSSYERIAANRAYFGNFDPFGDFDLLLGAARLNLKICDVPIRYRQRTYGDTNIQRWKHGWLLLRMVAFAARRVKFI